MARWRLTEHHYLFGHPPDLDECEWEYKETDRVSGREKRKRYKVPFLMEKEDAKGNPNIVCYEGKGQPTDTVFEGEPTPAMEPIDAEAEEISASFREKWISPIDALPGQGFSDALAGGFAKQLEEIKKGLAGQAAPVGFVSKEEFDELKNQLAQLIAQNAERSEAPAQRRRQ